jgi:hypothetical protein
MICAKCHNYNFGRCLKGLHITDEQIVANNFSCFKNRILHIDDKGEYGDEMSKSEIDFMKGYCQFNKDVIMQDDYMGIDIKRVEEMDI